MQNSNNEPMYYISTWANAPFRKCIILAFFVALCHIFLLAPTCKSIDSADSDDLLKINVNPGLGGFFRIGYWTPMTVTIDNKGPSFSGTAEVVLTQGSRLTQNPSTVTFKRAIFLPEYTKTTYTINCNLGSTPRPITARLLGTDGTEVIRQEFSIRQAMTLAPITLVVGCSSGYEQLIGAGPGMVSRKVAYLEPADFPNTWLSLSGVSMIVFNGVRAMDLSTSQLSALTQWIDTGGRMVLADGTGEKPTQVLAYSLLPVFINSRLTPLQYRKDQNPPLPSGCLVSDTIRKPGAKSPWTKVNSPLFGSTWAFGRGQVTYLPWDPLGTSFGSWPHQKELWKPLSPPIEKAMGSALMNAEEEDDSVLARIAPGIGAIYGSRWSVLAFSIIFVGGMLLLSRTDQIRSASIRIFWPVAALSISIFAIIGFFSLGLPGLRNNTGISEISLLIGRPECRYVQVISYINGFSPKSGSFNMTFKPDIQGLQQRPREGLDMPDTVYSLDDTYSTVTMKLDDWAGFDLTSTSVNPLPIKVDEPERIAKENRRFRVYKITNMTSHVLHDSSVLFEESVLDLGDIGPFESKTVRIPDRSTASEMVPVIDAVSLSRGDKLSGEESTNRVKALDAIADSYHATGPAFIGWLKEPVWDFVKYGGLRIRTSVGLVLMPIDKGWEDAGSLDEETSEEEYVY